MHTPNDVLMYWGDKMPLLAMEECGELIQAISKMERATMKYDIELEKNCKDNLCKEIADVVIACEALLLLYEIDKKEVEACYKKKLNKEY